MVEIDEIVDKNVRLLRGESDVSTGIDYSATMMTSFWGKTLVDFCYDPLTGEILELRDRKKDIGLYEAHPSHEKRKGIAFGTFSIEGILDDSIRIDGFSIHPMTREIMKVMEETMNAYNES